MSWLSESNRATTRGAPPTQDQFKKKESQLNEKISLLESTINSLNKAQADNKKELAAALARINKYEDASRNLENAVSKEQKEKQHLKMQLDSINLNLANQTRENQRLASLNQKLETMNDRLRDQKVCHLILFQVW